MLNIETIFGPHDGKVSYYLERGGIITSLQLHGEEILYMDENTLKDIKVNIKGGIPILFPNAGPLSENSNFPVLKQHGFAREMKWKKEKTENGFREILVSDEETKKMYPYNFRFSMIGNFEEDGSFTLVQEVENMGEDKEIPISMGLHPYFKVPNDEKNNIKFLVPLHHQTPRWLLLP